MSEKKSAEAPPDPDDPGYRAVYDFKRFVDHLVEKSGSEEAAIAKVNVGRGAFQGYRIPRPQGPSLATLGRLAHRLGMKLSDVVGPGARLPESSAMTHPAFLGLSPEQLERVIALLTAWETAGLLDTALSAAEGLTDHILHAKRRTARHRPRK